MRSILLIPALFAVAACTTPAPADPSPPTAASCNAEAAQSYVGRKADTQTVDAARKAAGARTARVLKPDQMVTMEYMEGRLNIYVDAANTIERIACG
jgi:hypothetical protein